MKPKVLVAMSGGVDSSVAAYLLKKQGYEVLGITFQLYDYSRLNRKEGKGGCCSLEDVDDARIVADRLGIRHYLVDSRQRFQKKVIDYFVSSYEKGETPNPCVACNTFIKFDELAEQAKALDVECFATGHYARIEKNALTGRAEIFQAVDAQKDQSYFLMGVPRRILDKILFPCGNYSKEEIRAFAEEAGLCTSQKKESMEICFVANNDYKSFLKQEKQLADRPGKILSEDGSVLGEHLGIHHFTIGQRKGLGSLGLNAHYVVELRPEANEVVVGPFRSLRAWGVSVEITEFDGASYYIDKPVKLKIRSRSTFIPARIVSVSGTELFAEFEEAQPAVTPGQFAVFYEEQKLLGGGPIRKAQTELRSDRSCQKAAS